MKTPHLVSSLVRTGQVWVRGGEVPSNQLDQLFQQIQYDDSPDTIMMKMVMVVKMMVVMIEMCNIHDNVVHCTWNHSWG